MKERSDGVFGALATVLVVMWIVLLGALVGVDAGDNDLCRTAGFDTEVNTFCVVEQERDNAVVKIRVPIQLVIEHMGRYPYPLREVE